MKVYEITYKKKEEWYNVLVVSESISEAIEKLDDSNVEYDFLISVQMLESDVIV